MTAAVAREILQNSLDSIQRLSLMNIGRPLTGEISKVLLIVYFPGALPLYRL